MSWDIVLFNSKEKILSVADLNESKLISINFCKKLAQHFTEIITDGKHRTIRSKDFEIDYYYDEANTTNKILSIYGKEGLYELIKLAKKEQWQIYDTALQQMIDLEHPANNGYSNFRNYLDYIKLSQK